MREVERSRGKDKEKERGGRGKRHVIESKIKCNIDDVKKESDM